jgi:hypothetical protein
MPTLSIVACRMLEDELVHLLTQDSDIRQLILIDGNEHMGLSRKLRAQNRPHIVMSVNQIQEQLMERNRRASTSLLGRMAEHGWRSAFRKASGSKKTTNTDLVVLVSIQRLGLHTDLELLKENVCENVRKLSPFSDGILIFYGRCGNSLMSLENDLKDLACPLYFLMDDKEERIDDCIATALGGNRNYDRTLAEHQDVAVFMTPMWASNWRMTDGSDKSTEPLKNRDMGTMLKGLKFSKVAKIDTGLYFEPGFDNNVDDFAKAYGLERIELKGGTEVVDKCYQSAKDRLLQASGTSAQG